MATKKTTTSSSGRKVKNLKFSYDGRKITAKWEFDTKKNKAWDYHSVKWQYWIPSVSKWSEWTSETKVRANVAPTITLGDTYSSAKIRVKPVQKAKRGKEKKWTGGDSIAETRNIGTKKAVPDTPDQPKVEITGTTLKAYVENYKTVGATIIFEIIKNDSVK